LNKISTFSKYPVEKEELPAGGIFGDYDRFGPVVLVE